MSSIGCAMNSFYSVHIESRICWIIFDVIGVRHYYAKQAGFISLLYAILLVSTVRGLIAWTRAEANYLKSPFDAPQIRAEISS
jgi:nicotinamide riboside transporter PnuC